MRSERDILDTLLNGLPPNYPSVQGFNMALLTKR
jgi:hypothetical protein